MTQTLSHLVIVVLSLGLWMGCAPAKVGDFRPEFQPVQSSGTTGFETSYGPATVGGDLRVEESRRQIEKESKAKPGLAGKILGVNVTRLNAPKSPDRFGSHSVLIEINVSDEPRGPILFLVQLKEAGTDQYLSDETSSNFGSKYTLTAEFADAKSKLASSGKINLKAHHGGRLESEVTIFVRTYLASVDLRQDGQSAEVLDESLADARAWVKNSVVVLGRSFYEMEVVSLNHKKKPSTQTKTETEKKESVLFVVSGEAVRTEGALSLPPIRSSSGLLSVGDVEMIGDAETTDARAFAVNVKTDQGKEARVALIVQNVELPVPVVEKVEEPDEKQGAENNTAGTPKQGKPETLPRSEPPAPIQQKKQEAAPRISKSDSYFDMPYGQPNFDRLTKVVDHFNKNFDLPGVQTQIQNYKKWKFLDGPLSRMVPVRSFIEESFHSLQVPATASLLTLNESAFFKSDQFPIEVAGHGDTGPFQFIPDTGRWIGLKVSQSNREIWDERRYFVPSACAAARLLNFLIGEFESTDATLALMAYNQGAGGAASLVSCTMKQQTCRSGQAALDLVRRYKFTFRDVSRLHMAKGNSAPAVGYVHRILALHFMAVDPQKYGVNWNEIPNVKIPEKVMFPPSGSIQDPACNQHAQQTVKTYSI